MSLKQKISAHLPQTDYGADELDQLASQLHDSISSEKLKPLHRSDFKQSTAKQELLEDKSFLDSSEEVVFQQLHSRCDRYHWYRLSRDTWFCEILSSAFSFGCLLAIIIILRRYNQQTLPDLGYGITVGALISLFTTLAVTSLMFPVSRGLSQLKWLHFTGQAKRISDLEKFDQASRGILGSFGLLFSLQQRLISRLGAIITIVVIAANALTQQAIGYVPYQVADRGGTALAPRAIFFDSYNYMTGGVMGAYMMPATPESNTMAAVLNGVLHDNSSVSFQGLECSTGNCTWNSYKTLGVCSSVADVSHLLVQDFETHPIGGHKYDWFTTSLPGVTKIMMVRVSGQGMMGIRSIGKYLENLFMGSTTPVWSGEDVKSISFPGLVNSTIADFFVVWSVSPPQQYESGGPRRQISRAVEVNLHFCVQHLRSRVYKGKAQTEQIGPPQTDFEYQDGVKLGDYYSGSTSAEDILNANATLKEPDKDFGFNRRAQTSLNAYINSLFNGTWSIGTDVDFPTPPPNKTVAIGLKPMYDLTRCYEIDQPSKCSIFLLEGYLKHFERYAGNMAMILSNRFRSELAQRNPVEGTAHHTITHVQVSWPWVAPIAVLVTCSLVFLVWVMWLNRRHSVKLWRGSNVALTRVIGSGAQGMYENSMMHVRARNIRMQLSADNEAWRLVGGS